MVKGKNRNSRRRGIPVKEVSQFSPNDHEARRRIAEKAYELYERRGFCHGCDLDDWLESGAAGFGGDRRASRKRRRQNRSNSEELGVVP